MTHIPFRESDCERTHDYIVVGTGAGGATAAVALARAGEDVCVIEAGPWRDPEHYPSTSYGAMRDLFDDWGLTITRGRALWPVVQARCVGGTTVINSAICVRTPDDIFEQWDRDYGLPGLREPMLSYQDDIEHELCVEEVPKRARGNSNRLAMLGGKTMGYDSHVMRRYVKGCEGSGQCLQGCRKLSKQSTNINYIPEVREKGGVILSSAFVSRVLFEGKRAAAVTGRFRHPLTRKKGGTFKIRARKGIFIAASATHTPALLQRSGVRNKSLGGYFRAHPGSGIFGVYDDPVDMNIGATQGWASTAFRKDPGLKLETLSIPLEMVASRLSGGGPELMKRLTEFRNICMWVQACRAETVGSVRNGFGGKPVVSYELNREDMVRFRAGMHLVAKTHFAAGAKKIIPGIHGLPYTMGPDEVDKLLDAPLDPRRYIAILSHLFGGAVMGSDPNRSVCDEEGRVRGHEGLFVACAALIPTNLGVNPQHTIMALARRVVERHLDRVS